MAAGGNVDTSAVQDGMQRIQDYKDQLVRTGNTTGMGEKLRQFAEREAERARIAAAMQHRHAALNAIVRDRLETAVQSYMRAGLSPRAAILAILEGSQKGVAGARSSVAAMNLAYESRFIGGMMAELASQRPHLVVALQDQKMDADVMREMSELREGGRPGITGNEDAKFVAGVFAKYAELARTDLNRLGASIGKLDGWAGPQAHDDLKMIAAGKESWIEAITPRLDMERTFPDLLPSERRQVLGDIYDNITTGMPTNRQPSPGGRANPANLAKSLGKSRVLHFRDADAALSYRAEFGHGNTVSGMFAHLRNSARMAANMEVLGPNPENMINTIADSTARRIRDSSATPEERAGRLAEYDRQIAALDADQTITPAQRKNLVNRATRRRAQVEAAPIMSAVERDKLLSTIGLEGGRVTGQIRQALDISTGLASRPIGDGVNIAKIGNDIRAVQAMAKLGGSTISSFSDVAVNAAAATFRGSSFFKTFVAQLDAMRRGRPKGEVAEISFLLGEGFDGLVGHIVSPAVAYDGPVGKLSQLQNTFFKWNGQNWWTDVSRAAAGRIISAEMGMRAGTTFGRLPPAYRHVLELHGIDAQRWEIIRAAGVRKIEGKSYITPDLIRQLDDATIAPLVSRRLAAEQAATDKRIEQLSARNEQEREWVAGRRQKLDQWMADADARVESARAGNEVRSQIDTQIAQRRIELERATIEAAQVETDLLQSVRGIADQTRARQLLRELEDGRSLDATSDRTDALIERAGGRVLRAGESLGTRRQRARQKISRLEKEIRDIERKATKRDADLVRKDFEAFQRRMAEVQEFVDRSYSRELGRLDQIAALEAGRAERVAGIINDGRRDLELNVLRFFADETNYGLLEPDARSRRFTTRAMRPGTFGGEAIRFVAQFKSFPVAFTQRVLGRAVFGHRKDAGFLERFKHIGALVAGTMMAGYVSMTAKDMVRGYWPPRNPADPKVLMAAFVQGGSAGIYGDFLFSQVNRFGGGPLETLAGPTIGSVADAVEIGLRARDAAAGLITGQEAKLPAADALTWALGNTPFVNLFYTRPVLDYLFINSLRDAVSPGYLKRQRAKREEEMGQQPLDPFGFGQTAFGPQ
jgi:hypothetical protein